MQLLRPQNYSAVCVSRKTNVQKKLCSGAPLYIVVYEVLVKLARVSLQNLHCVRL